jgi:class 3 adenylate cyclase
MAENGQFGDGVLNRYLTVMSDPVRRHNGIIDKYIGDGIMAFWGPPFTGADEQARLACLAALDHSLALPHFVRSCLGRDPQHRHERLRTVDG